GCRVACIGDTDNAAIDVKRVWQYHLSTGAVDLHWIIEERTSVRVARQVEVTSRVAASLRARISNDECPAVRARSRRDKHAVAWRSAVQLEFCVGQRDGDIAG